MATRRRAPAGQTKTGPQRTDSKNPGGTRGSDPDPIGKLEVGNEQSAPPGGRRSGPTGAESMSQLDAERVPFEDPQRIKDGIRDAGPVDEE